MRQFVSADNAFIDMNLCFWSFMLSIITVVLFFPLPNCKDSFAASVSYQECSTASTAEHSSFWIAVLYLPVSVWDFATFWRKYLGLLEWNALKWSRTKWHLAFPNEGTLGLKCCMHLIWLAAQSCMGSHKKLWCQMLPECLEPSLAQRISARPVLCLGIT